MKKTRILSVAALATIMAACSNEEIAVLENNALQQDLNIRPLVENTAILDGVESRMEVTGSYRPQLVDGDKIGAALIDDAAYTDKADYQAKKELGKTAEELYNIAGKIYSNYPYEKVDGAWYTQASLVEGNYMFYAPYNAANSFIRTAPVVKLPAKQTVTSKTSAIDEFAASGEIVKVGYAFMDAEGSMRPSVAMQDVFAYPLITLKNNFKGYLFDQRTSVAGYGVPTLYQGEIKVDSIQIYKSAAGNVASADDVIVEAGLKFGTADIAANQTEGLVYALRDVEGANTNPWYAEWLQAYTGDILGTDEVVERQVITTLVLGKTLAQGAVETFNVVMPAMAYGKNLCATVYVTIGEKQYQINNSVTLDASSAHWTADEPALDYTGVTDATIKFNNVSETGVTLVKAQQYPAEGYNISGTAKEDAASLLTINLVGGEATGYAGAEAYTEIEATVVQAAFEWDPAAPTAYGIANNEQLINWFKNTERNTILQETPVADIDQKNEFNLLVENTVTINAALVDALADYNGGGSIVFTSLLPIANDVRVTNVVPDGSVANVTFESLASEESFTITIPVEEAPAAIDADGNYIVDTNVVTSVTKVVDGEETLTNVNLFVTATATGNIALTNIKDAANISTINNIGTLNINADMDASALTIINSGEMTLAAANQTNATIINYGTFNNNGMMRTAGINNAAIVAGAGSTTKIAGGEGTVNNNVAATVAVTGGTQTVSYTLGDITNAQTDIAATTGINKLIVTGNVTANDSKYLLKPLKNFTVSEMEIQGTAVTTSFASADLAGLTIKFTQVVTWTGATAGTTLTNCTFVTDDNVNLTNVTASGTISPITPGTEVEVVAGAWSSWN